MKSTRFFSAVKQLPTWWVASVLAGIGVALFLRLWQLASLPPSLYWEEVALGYDAYSLAQTARDHHGNFLPVVALESFGDFKPAFYAYAIVPFIQLFGLSAWAVRLPSALAGVGSVALMGVLAWFLAPIAKRFQLSAVVIWVAAISPWGLMFSRAGWEVNLATFLIIAGVVSGLQATQSQRHRSLAPHINFWPVLATAFLILSTYTYHAARILSPVLGLGLAVEWWRQGMRFNQWRTWGVVGAVALAMILPLGLALTTPAVGQRWAETSLFADGKIVLESNARREAQPGLVSYVIYHRYVLAARELSVSYLKHFTPDFLFVTGDANGRHATHFGGELYHIELVWLLLGLGGLYYWGQKSRWLLGWWLGWGILPAAMTVGSPHALRILPTWPVWMVLIAFGLLASYELHALFWRRYLSHRWPTVVHWSWFLVVGGIYVIEFGMFWRFYTLIYPVTNSQDWQYGYAEMIQTVHQAQTVDPTQNVFISRQQGRPAMYYWFYTQTDPRLVQAANDTSLKDQGEFLTFGNVSFFNVISQVKKGIVAVSPEQYVELTSRTDGRLTLLKEVRNLRNQVVWVVARYE